jgi:hypothetical protein
MSSRPKIENNKDYSDISRVPKRKIVNDIDKNYTDVT